MKVFFAITISLCALLTAAHPTANQADMFDTLDEYSLLGILEQLEFADLAAVAAVHPRVIQMADNYDIMPAIRGKNVTLRIQLSMRDLEQAQAFFIPLNDALNVTQLCTGYDHIRMTLQAFCPLFGRLILAITTDYGAPSNRTPEVVDYINRYCAAIPQKMVVRNAGAVFQRFAAASNVSSVLIDYPENHKNLLINTFFPQLQELVMRINGFFAIEEHLPHLQHLEMADSNCGHFDLKSFAAFNPQVRSLKLDLCQGLDALHEVNELYPNLESLHYRPKKDEKGLALQKGENGVESVRFRNVTSYAVVILGHQMERQRNQAPPSLSSYLAELSAIQFDRLESLTYITWANVERNAQLDFVLQYKEIKCLDYSSYDLTYEEIWRLVESLPKLREITFRAAREHADLAELGRLMQESSLETIRVWVHELLVDEFRGIVLPEQWILYSDERKATLSTALTFRRQNSQLV